MSPASARRYRFQRLVSLGQPAPGGGFHGGSFEIDGLNRAGQAVVGSDMENPWGRGEALYLLAPNRETRIAAPGDPAPGGRRYGSVIWMPPGINAHGQVVWAGQMENGEAWLLTYDARSGRTEVVERPGMPAPGGGTFESQGRQRIVINNTGDIAFDAYLPGARGMAVPGVFVVSDGEMHVVAREGTPAPNGGGFLAAETPAINDAREIVFQGTVAGSQWLGVYLWQEGFITPVATPGTRVRLPDDRQPAGEEIHRPLTSFARDAENAEVRTEPRAATLQAAFYPQIDARGRVVFVGRTERGDGFYRWSRGRIAPILEMGDPVPGVGRLEQIHFHRRRPFFLNARGDVAFSGEAGGRSGVFVWSRGAIHVVARADEFLPGVGHLTQVGSPDSSYSYPSPTLRVGTRPAGAAGFPPGYRPPPGMMAPPYGYLPPGVGVGPGPGYLGRPPTRAVGRPSAPAHPRPAAAFARPQGMASRAVGPGRRPPTEGPSASLGSRPPGLPPIRSRAPRSEGRPPMRAFGVSRPRSGLSWPSAAGNPSMGPYGMPGGAPYGGYYGQPFGLVLGDDGKLLLPAMVDDRPCVVLALPRGNDKVTR